MYNLIYFFVILDIIYYISFFIFSTKRPNIYFIFYDYIARTMVESSVKPKSGFQELMEKEGYVFPVEGETEKEKWKRIDKNEKLDGYSDSKSYPKSAVKNGCYKGEPLTKKEKEQLRIYGRLEIEIMDKVEERFGDKLYWDEINKKNTRITLMPIHEQEFELRMHEQYVWNE